ncbi:hypothetical protein AMECASPLE_012133 [Ameca splendens]|uniref:Uncharacterized protein n=1 Tax=Ameca splendens TaxID=208324 RepID=A0ABV0ZAS9_9TELE
MMRVSYRCRFFSSGPSTFIVSYFLHDVCDHLCCVFNMFPQQIQQGSSLSKEHHAAGTITGPTHPVCFLPAFQKALKSFKPVWINNSACFPSYLHGSPPTLVSAGG